MKGYKEIPLGGKIIEAGNAEKYETGSWRTYRPIWDKEKCKNCLLCWIYCPDSSIILKDGKMVGQDYRFCKGCGICARECPFQAIEMKPESEYKK
ncbi:MAG: ferredoxin [Nitrospirae bacterium]|nr:ferredoxin [Nitrospirota bacterium]